MAKGLFYIYLTIMISSMYIIECTGSAIPMWEYLTRDEKVSSITFLYQ